MAGRIVKASSVAAAASQGSTRDLLIAMRDLIAKDLDDGVAPRDLASLTKRLMEITREIEALDAARATDGVGRAAAAADSAWPAA